MAYTPPLCNAIEFVFAGSYTPPACNAVELLFGDVVPGRIPVGGSLMGKLMPWGGIRFQPCDLRAPWDAMAALDPSARISHADAATEDALVSIPWRGTGRMDHHRRIPWEVLDPDDASIKSPWISMDAVDNHRMIPWEDLFGRDRSTGSLWLAPGTKDRGLKHPWEIFNHHQDAVRLIPWLAPGTKDRHHQTQWGPLDNFQFCFKKYFPPGCSGSEIEFEPGSLLPGVCDGLTLFFDHLSDDLRCPYQHRHTGWRDRYVPVIIVPESTAWPSRLRVYRMLNTILLKRLPDNVQFDALSVSMSTDRDSWLWSFSLEIPSRSYLDLIKPQGDTLIDIEININGWKWICRVEGWRENKSFGRTTWTVSGRSPSAELGEPYCGRASFVSDTDTQGAQFVTDILQYSGWGSVWTPSAWLNPLTDWLIPAGAFSYSSATKIEAIQALAQAVGAVVQTPPDTVFDKNIKILPRYIQNPWTWPSLSPAVGLIDAQCEEIGRACEARPLYNAAVVSGVNFGRVVSAKRAGTAGDLQAPTETSDLITTVQAGSEACRIIMGASGRWIKHSLRLFSLYPTGTPPGLVLPGTMVAVAEGASTWNGQVTGTAINASNISKQVRQNLEVEEYRQ